jgi:F-type H+-transporting ATPase subunit delta
MRETGLAARYAEALFGAATARGVADAVGPDLQSLLTLDARDPSFRTFLESPGVGEEAKRRVIEEVLGPRVHPLTTRFLRLLLAKKRIPYLAEAARAFAALLERQQGIVRARVTSAVPLDDDQRARLRAALERRTGFKVVLEPRVDRAVIGGVVVQYGDHILDDTVRARLAGLRERLLAAPL